MGRKCSRSCWIDGTKNERSAAAACLAEGQNGRKVERLMALVSCLLCGGFHDWVRRAAECWSCLPALRIEREKKEWECSVFGERRGGKTLLFYHRRGCCLCAVCASVTGWFRAPFAALLMRAIFSRVCFFSPVQKLQRGPKGESPPHDRRRFRVPLGRDIVTYTPLRPRCRGKQGAVIDGYTAGDWTSAHQHRHFRSQCLSAGSPEAARFSAPATSGRGRTR